MDDFDIPIFKKSYELYKTFYGYRTITNHSICQKPRTTKKKQINFQPSRGLA